MNFINQHIKLFTLVALSSGIFSTCAQTKTPVNPSIQKQSSNSSKKVPLNLKWSERMLLSEMHRFPEAWMLDFSKTPKWTYPTAIVLDGAEKLHAKTGKKEYYNYINQFGEKLIQEDGTIITYDLDKYNIDMLNSGNVLLYLYEKEKKRKIPESTSDPSSSDRRTAKNERRFFLAQKDLSLSGMVGWFIHGNAFLHALYTRLRERSRCGKSV